MAGPRVTMDTERIARAANYAQAFPGSRAADPDFTVVEVQVRWRRWYDASDASRAVAVEATSWGECQD